MAQTAPVAALIAAHLLKPINDQSAQRVLTVERGVLGEPRGDCHTACSVHAAYDESSAQVQVTAAVFDPEVGLLSV
ncbi:hypothetical protein ACH4MN_11740 [Streptomyces anulatus]|uniref:hypothetical protein n=1 Tax=Streptomyces globisporus TaxID=1908 RepID=UPI0037BCB30A